MEPKDYSNMDRPAIYRMKVRGRFGKSWSEYFNGLTITDEKHKDGAALTVLSGVIPDQAALHGLIQKFRDLGLVIVEIQMVEYE